MSQGSYNTVDFAEQTIDECVDESDGGGVSDTAVMRVVLDLWDEKSQASRVDTGVSELPSFAEEAYEVHKLDLAPSPHTLRSRERVLRVSGDWTALARVLIERAEQTRQESDAASLLVEAAGLYLEHLDNTVAAQIIFCKALEIDPSHQDAADKLEALTESTGQWQDLIQTFSDSARRLTTPNPSCAGEFMIRVAFAEAHGLHDLSHAFERLDAVEAAIPLRVDVYLNTLERAARGSRQLETMISLSRRIGDWDRSVRLMSRAIAMSQSVVERANYHHGIAQIEARRDEEDVAIWHWNEAIRLDPRRNEFRDALAGLYQQRGEFSKAVELIEAARVSSVDVARRAQYACEAAQICSDHLGENTRAVDLFAVALKAQPGNEVASIPVIDRYFEQQRWEELDSVLDSFFETCADGTLLGDEVSELRYKAGACALALGNYEKALSHLQHTLGHQPDRIDALESTAHCRARLGEHSEAIAATHRALEARKHRGDDESTWVPMLAVSAAAHHKIGQLDKCIELYQRCVRHDDVASMEALADLHSLRGDHHRSVALRLRVAESASTETKVTLLCEVASTLGNEMGDLEAAIDLCWQALSLDNKSRAALHLLAVLYTQNNESRDAIKTILKMAGLETSSYRRARYLQAAAAIAEQENQVEEAVALFDRAIESYFGDTAMAVGTEIRETCFDCFNKIVVLLSAAENWRELERNYRKMICRMEPGDPDVAALWSALGHVYKENLGETTAAIDSFEVAASLDRESLSHHRVLVDLYQGAGQDQIDKAIERRRYLLEAEPSNAEHYKALRGLYVRTRQGDGVWCLCRALESMGAAEDREVAYFRRNMPAQMKWPERPLNSEMWSRLRDARVNPHVSRIYGLVSEVISLRCARSLRQTETREQMGADFDPLRQLFSATSYALGLPVYDCFVEQEQQRPVALLNLHRAATLEPTFALGDRLFRGRSIAEIVSGLGRTLALGRRSYYLRLALKEPTELAAAFYAGLSLVDANTTVPAALRPRVEMFRLSLRKSLHPMWMQKLHQAVNAFSRDGAQFDLQQWSHGADATGRHAALLLSGDLKFGLSEIPKEGGLTKGQVEDEQVALRLASVSSVHFALRSELGLMAVLADD